MVSSNIEANAVSNEDAGYYYHDSCSVGGYEHFNLYLNPIHEL